MNQAFYSVKGGQGTTVTAAAAALTIAENGTNVLLVDFSGGDSFAVLGLPEPTYGDAEPRGVTENLRVMAQNPDAVRLDSPQFGLPYAEVYIFDAPASDVAMISQRWDAAPVLVIRPCYLALRRAIASAIPTDSVVLIEEPGRSLRADDVAAILNVSNMLRVRHDPAVARAVDAGLLASRLPDALRNATGVAVG